MEKKVYVIFDECITCDDVSTSVFGVFASEESAKARMKEAIEVCCVGIKEDIEENLEEEDLEGYESFEEYWDEWVEERFESPTFWLYWDDDSQIVIKIIEKILEE